MAIIIVIVFEYRYAGSARPWNKPDAGPLHRLAGPSGGQPYGEPRAGAGANRLLRSPQAGPAAGANITWTSCTAGTQRLKIIIPK